MNMKCTPQLRAQIEAAAAASGRSISAEVQYRVEASFIYEWFIKQLLSERAGLAESSGEECQTDAVIRFPDLNHRTVADLDTLDTLGKMGAAGYGLG
jgi:hypothetical protein